MYPTQVTALAVLQGGSVTRALPPMSVTPYECKTESWQVRASSGSAVFLPFEQGTQFGQHSVYLKYSY